MPSCADFSQAASLAGRPVCSVGWSSWPAPCGDSLTADAPHITAAMLLRFRDGGQPEHPPPSNVCGRAAPPLPFHFRVTIRLADGPNGVGPHGVSFLLPSTTSPQRPGPPGPDGLTVTGLVLFSGRAALGGDRTALALGSMSCRLRPCARAVCPTEIRRLGGALECSSSPLSRAPRLTRHGRCPRTASSANRHRVLGPLWAPGVPVVALDPNACAYFARALMIGIARPARAPPLPVVTATTRPSSNGGRLLPLGR